MDRSTWTREDFEAEAATLVASLAATSEVRADWLNDSTHWDNHLEYNGQ